MCAGDVLTLIDRTIKQNVQKHIVCLDETCKTVSARLDHELEKHGMHAYAHAHIGGCISPYILFLFD